MYRRYLVRVKRKYKSDLERQYAKRLRRVPPEYEVSYETHKLNYVLEKTYYPDFVCEKDDKVFYIEAKGYFRKEDRVKLLAVREANPGIDLRLAFAVDNKLHRKSKIRYSDWCIKNGFTYCIGEIPNEWFR